MAESMLEVRTLQGETAKLAEGVVQAFRAGCRGQVLRAGDPDYDEQRKVWNGMFDRRPALIVRCTGTADVRHAVAFARDHQLLSSVRGGGHNVAGTAVCEGGLMIDLSPMRGVWVDPVGRTARAQSGCTLGDVDRETQVHGLAAVLGFVSATGIAGLTVGGGFGYLTRRAGWTCDNVVSMEVVTADAKVLRASASENPDLFWALRGGSGNFGIVTSFEYVLHDVGPEVYAGLIAWRAEDAPEVLRFLAELTSKLPRETTLIGAMRNAPPAPFVPKEMHGKPIVAIFVCHTGRPEDGERLIAPLKAFGKPVADVLTRRPYTQMQSLIDATAPKGRRYYWKSEYLPGLEPGLIDAVVARAKLLTSPHSLIALFHLEGALNQLPAEHSPAGNRDARFVLNIASAWESPADDDAQKAWTRDTWQAIKPFSTGGVYVNFLSDDDGADRIEAAYGKATLDRLGAIKRKYDPQNLFRHTKNVVQAG